MDRSFLHHLLDSPYCGFTPSILKGLSIMNGSACVPVPLAKPLVYPLTTTVNVRIYDVS